MWKFLKRVYLFPFNVFGFFAASVVSLVSKVDGFQRFVKNKAKEPAYTYVAAVPFWVFIFSLILSSPATVPVFVLCIVQSFGFVISRQPTGDEVLCPFFYFIQFKFFKE